MSEHIVARALRARADALRKAAALHMHSPSPAYELLVAEQFEMLADELAEIEGKPVAEQYQADHPQFRVKVDYSRLASQVEVTPAGGRLTIGHNRLQRAASRMCDAYLGDGRWDMLAEGARMQWVQLAMLAIEAALGPGHD